MCHKSCIEFSRSFLDEDEVKDKSVIDIGSLNINGSSFSTIKMLHPKEYIGVDMEMGPGVDIICRAENVVDKFGENSFDVVISNEMLEHAKNWRDVISNIKRVCKPGGTILITTRSLGFPYHGYPYDFWRYELTDMEKIFSDCDVLVLKDDPQGPGVFIKVRKPENFSENDLSDYKLYSILVEKKIIKIKTIYYSLMMLRIIKPRVKFVVNSLMPKIIKIIGKFGKFLKKNYPLYTKS